ncbi:MAG: potassium/proton antiporter [Bacteroidales bacterium]|nr:potassium/proton antiporter [Bacteroidales bacterium]
MQIELVLLVLSLLFFASIMAGKAGSRFGVPALLLFLAVGMLFGSDGLGIHFESLKVAQMVGTVALSAILFSGGLDTKFADIKPVLGAGLSLATLGVLLTAVITALVLWLVAGTKLGIGFMLCLLLASTMSSTDSASVFSILRGKGLNLKNNLRPTLELESGSNDPMAYLLTVTLISLVQQGGSPNIGSAVVLLVVQLLVGTLAGWLFGKGLVWIINHINLENVALYPILVLVSSFFVFAATHFMLGNSYLAVYVAGLVVGNSQFVHKRSTRNFFDGVSWLAQLSMFLTLGLLVNPSELKEVLVPGLIVSVVMIFVSRPLAVLVSLLPFRRYTMRDRLFVSWVGLRGAVPIIFAILCRASGVPHSDTMFNIVFLCTLVSLVVQGTTLPLVAKWLGVLAPIEKRAQVKNFDIDFPEEIKSTSSEIEITAKMLEGGNRLMDLKMPAKTLAIMVKRGESFFVPTGKTTLLPNDRLMVITDDLQALDDTLKALGAEPQQEQPRTEKRKWTSMFFDDSAT